MKTLLDTLNSGTEWLEKRGVEDARRNMQLMLCEVLGFDNPMQLYTHFDRPLEETELTPLREMIKKRSQRIPLQHIIGWVEFYKRKFNTDSRALIPRPETEELADLVLSKNLNPNPRILDLGTGSGVLGLTLAAELEAKGSVPKETVLSDVSEEALSLAKENAAQLFEPPQLNNILFCQSNLFESISESFDLIVANLPYIPEREKQQLSPEVGYDPDLALFSGEDGLDLIRQFVSEAPNYLNPNGLVAMEIGIHQHKQVEILLADAGFSAIETERDLNGIQRFPMARK